MEIKQRVIVDVTDEGIYYKFPKKGNLEKTNTDEESVLSMSPIEYWEEGEWRMASDMSEVLAILADDGVGEA